MNVLFAVLIVVGLFGGMFLMLELGLRIGRRRPGRALQKAGSGLAPVDTAVFGLMGLLIAFTFSGAAERFDVRRRLIAEETNAISTAYQRLDLLPASAQPKLREHLRKYLDARLAFFQKLPDLRAAGIEWAKANALQSEIWSEAVAAFNEATSPATPMLVLPAVNSMIDITVTRTMALLTHPPTIIFVMLAVLAFVSSCLAGYEMGTSGASSWVHRLSFTILIAVSIYITLDIEFPRAGLIRVHEADQVMFQLRERMK